MSELEVVLIMLAVVAAYSLVYTNFVAGSSDSREKSHTALGGRSVGNRCAGRGQREQGTPSDCDAPLGVVHPRTRVLNTLAAPAAIVHGASGDRYSPHTDVCGLASCRFTGQCSGECDDGGVIF